MTRTILIVSTLVIALAITAAPLVEAHPRFAGPAGPLARLARLRAELNLSDAQVAEIKVIFRTLREENAAYREQLRGSRGAVFETLLANPSDVAGARALVDHRAQAERAMRANAVAAVSRALSVLTTEQREQLARIVAERKARVGARR